MNKRVGVVNLIPILLWLFFIIDFSIKYYPAYFALLQRSSDAFIFNCSIAMAEAFLHVDLQTFVPSQDALNCLIVDIYLLPLRIVRQEGSAIAAGLFISFILSLTRQSSLGQRGLSRPPGWRLHCFAETWFSKKTFTQVLEPILSDMQLEYFEALAAKRPWKARIVLLRGYLSFWSAVVAQAPLSVLSLLYKVWKTTKIGS